MKIYSDYTQKNSKNQEEFKKIPSYYEEKSISKSVKNVY